MALFPYDGPMSRFVIYDPLAADIQALDRGCIADICQMNPKDEMVKIDDNKFIVKIDTHHFKPEELKVKLDKNKLIIHGKHEDKQDEHGYIERDFTRTYVLPDNCDTDHLKSHINKKGIMCIECPRKPDKAGVRHIPIERANATKGH